MMPSGFVSGVSPNAMLTGVPEKPVVAKYCIPKNAAPIIKSIISIGF